MSKRVRRAMPLWPPTRACQFLSVPVPRGETRPMPVTTTRRSGFFSLLMRRTIRRCAERGGALLGVPHDIVDGLADRGQLLGLVVGDIQPELLLEGHDQLDGVQGVGTEIVDEGRVLGDLLLTDAQLVGNDGPDFLEQLVSFHGVLLQRFLRSQADPPTYTCRRSH